MSESDEVASDSDSSDPETDECDLDEKFDLNERAVHKLQRLVKTTLESIDPGFGDRITLSNFCQYVRARSSALSTDA